MTIHIWEPRWKDRVVLVADRKLEAHNHICIDYIQSNGEPLYPHPLYISGEQARSFPLEDMATKAGGVISVRAIPLTELEKEAI